MIYLVYYFTDEQDMNHPDLDAHYNSLHAAKQRKAELQALGYNVLIEQMPENEYYGE